MTCKDPDCPMHFPKYGKDETVPVRKNDLEHLARFRCRHSGKMKPEETCYDHPEQGGCCNSCWVRTWAKQMLGEVT